MFPLAIDPSTAPPAIAPDTIADAPMSGAPIDPDAIVRAVNPPRKPNTAPLAMWPLFTAPEDS